MPLILAIDHDKRQSTQLASLVKAQLQAELVQRPTVAEALDALRGRVPDLVLTSSLISPRDDAALATHLRDLGAAAAHVQTVTIPMLGSAAPQRAKGVLAALRREKPPAPMTEGCAPDVFAEQIRQYLVTAEEQKIAVSVLAKADAQTHTDRLGTQAWASFEAAPVEEPAAIEDAPSPVFEPDDLYAAPEPDAIADVAIEPDATFEPDVEPDVMFEPAVAFEPVVAEAPAAVELTVAVEAEPEPLVSDEPAGLPLSQLLQLVSDWTIPAVHASPEPEPEPLEIFAAPAVPTVIEEPLPVFEESVFEEIVEPPVAALDDELPAVVNELEGAPAPAASVGELSLDPVAARALEELSRQVPAVSLGDGIPLEPPVPVVEMHSFQSLDSIANELAAGPVQRHDSLDDIASLFAATPAPRRSAPEAAPVFEAPRGREQGFESLFAAPPAPAPMAPIEVPGIDPSLFAAPSTPHARHETRAMESLFVPLAADRDEIFAAPAVFAEPVLPAPISVVAAPIEAIVFEPADVEPAPEAAVLVDRAERAAVEPIFAEPAPVEPMVQEPVLVEPVLVEPVLVEPVLVEPVHVEPVLEEPVLEEPLLAEPVFVEAFSARPVPAEPVFAEPVAAEPLVAAAIVAEPAVPEPMAEMHATVDSLLDDEIALDVDAFEVAMPVPAAASAANADPPRFSFTFVDSFGDAWSDFEVPTVAAVAADLGVAAHGPTDPYAPVTAPTTGVTATVAAQRAAAAPMLDDEALSMIGDAARKVGLDALVIEEFERGVRNGGRKAKPKKPHVNAAPVPPPAAERPAKKKGPVQDEWGLFDPEQCGFAALEDEETGERRPARDGTRVRIISY